ncbi:MAG: NACHT domain-containing protein, partial [Anaerolineae bacterium]
MSAVAIPVGTLAEQLEEMNLHLRWSERGCLLIAATSDPDLEAAIAEDLKRRLAGEVEVLDFTFAGEPVENLSLSYRLRTLPPPDGNAVLFVYGLDDLSPEDRETAIRSLNWGRERLAWAGYSVVLWVRTQTLGDLMLRAPDFYSWRSGAYEFDLPTDQAARAGALSTLRLFAPAELEELRQRYCDYVVESYRWLDFRGLLQVRNIVRFKLEDIYVSLRATMEEKRNWGELAELGELRGRGETREEAGAAVPPDLLEVIFKRSAEREQVELDKALQEHQRLVVLGDPGSGKSTLLKYLALTFAEGRGTARERLGLDEDRLPVLLPISAYAAALKEEDLSLSEYLPRHFAEHQLPDLTPLFQHELELGRALVLLDGLDEVLRTEDRLEVTRRVEAFARRYRRNRFVVTSRIAGYSAGPLRGDFAHFTIEPFNDDQIRWFAVNWSRAYEATAGWSPQAEQRAGRRAENLVEAVNSHPAIHRLAANPLLLTILALIHYQGTRLPHRRVELYRLCVEALAETWNLARSLAEQPIELWVGDRRLDEEQVVRVLAPIAYWMHKEVPSGLVERRALEEQVARHLAVWKGPREASRLAHQFLELVREQVGLLVERGLDQFGFMHLTFEEYLAARYIADQRERERKALVLKHLHDPRWWEVILLAAGSLSAPQTTDLVHTIWKAGSPYEELLHRDLLMAGRCLADDVPVSYHLRRHILDDLFDLWRTTRYAKLRKETNDTLVAMRGTASQDQVVAKLLVALEDESEFVRRRAPAAPLGSQEQSVQTS